MSSEQCSICLANYQIPKLLSCHHVFCLECIRNIYHSERTGSIKCPLCRKPTDMPGGGCEALSDYTTSSDEIRFEVKNCGFCYKDAAAEFRCNDCEDFLCLDCKNQHIRMKQTKNHMIVILEDDHRTWKKTDQYENCMFHGPFLLQFFCANCGTVCCDMGRHNNHKSHTIMPLAEAAEEKRNVVKSYIEEAEEHYTTVINEVYDILVDQDKLTTFLDRQTSDIDSAADQLKRSIDGAAGELKIQMTRAGETLNQKMKESLQTNNDKAKKIMSLIQSTDQILNEASNKDFLSFQEDVTNHLKEELTKFKVKDPQFTYLPMAEVKDALINNIQEPTVVRSLLQPLRSNKVKRSFNVEGKGITALACLSNGAVLVCQGNAKRMNVVGARGQDLGTFAILLRIGSLKQTADGTIVATEFSGTRAATFRLWADAITMKSLSGLVQSVSTTRDGTCLLFCRSDTKAAKKNHAMNGHILITNLAIEVQMQLNVSTCGDILRFCFQKSNGDFIAATSRTCFILSSIGQVKSSFYFVGAIHGACMDKRDNFIIVRDEAGSKIVTLLDSNLEGRKDLIKLTDNPLGVNVRFCMAVDDQGDMWVGYGNTIQCIRYIL